jgi:hypothetical protein
MRHPTGHPLEPIHEPQIHEPTEYADNDQNGVRQHIKYDEEYVHSQIRGSIQCDPLLESLPECESLRHRWPLCIHISLERM